MPFFLLLQISDVTKAYGPKVILDHFSLDLYCGDRIAITGKKGSGKSTLGKVIAGVEPPDSGTLQRSLSCSSGYIPQKLIINDASCQIRDVLTASHKHKQDLFARLNKLEVKLARNVAPQEQIQLLQEWQLCRDKAKHEGWFDFDHLFDKVTRGLELHRLDMTASFSTLPQEEQKRVLFASHLLLTPDILVLDEPTAHLSASFLPWLEEYLQMYFGAVIVISKNQKFLSVVTNKTLEVI
jgi:ATPase subunit of ABC transporter with duplicated ATPase domains